MKNKTNKLSMFIFAILLGIIAIGSTPNYVVFADDGNVASNIVVYDENNNYLFEKSEVFIGDEYLSKDFKKYEIIYVNHENRTGIAKFIKQVAKPKIKISPTPSKVSQPNKKIKLYSTHNDESYLPSDGYYTIYGKGGVHDVGNALKVSLENRGVNVEYDESLHLPHDASAYTRSRTTANRLLKENDVDAIFDVHRDGIPRSYYLANDKGQEKSKIRIVVGKANSYMSKNEEFALYLVAVAQELYPWLISDIYYASGHYNQNLFPKALLFEMGTYLIEKELVMRSIEPLTHVIDVALYNTTVNVNTGDLEIGGEVNEEQQTINEILKPGNKYSTAQTMDIVVLIVSVLVTVIIIGAFSYYVYVKHYKNNDSDKN